MSSAGFAWPKGRSNDWPSPDPNPSSDTVKFCTLNSCAIVGSFRWQATYARVSHRLASTARRAPSMGPRLTRPLHHPSGFMNDHSPPSGSRALYSRKPYG